MMRPTTAPGQHVEVVIVALAGRAGEDVDLLEKGLGCTLPE
jgi:hypothetical protein